MITQSAHCCFMHATNAHAHIEHCEPSTVKRAVDHAVTRAVTCAVFRNFLTATLAPSPYQLPALLRATSGQCANVLPQSDLASALPHELQRIMPPPPSRRRAVALLADQLLGLATRPVLLATGPPCLSTAAP